MGWREGKMGSQVVAAAKAASASQHYQYEKPHHDQEKKRLSRPDASCAAAFGSGLGSLRLILALLKVVYDEKVLRLLRHGPARPAAVAAPRYRHFPFLLLLLAGF